MDIVLHFIIIGQKNSLFKAVFLGSAWFPTDWIPVIVSGLEFL